MNRKDIIKGILVLLAVTVLSGYLLAQVYRIAKPRIEEQKRQQEEKLNKEIFPEGVRFAEEKIKGMNCTAIYTTKTAKVNAEENPAGRIFNVRILGYSGYITAKVGLDKELKIKGVRILEHSETPGLGSKITDKKFLEQFQNKKAGSLYLKKNTPEGKIDAVTGATISSKAVTDGIRKLQKKLE